MIDPSRVVYRDATCADAPALTRHWRDTFMATFGHLYPPADIEAYFAKHDEAQTVREIEDASSRCRLALDAGRIIAAAKMGAYKLPVDPVGARVRELHRLYVVEEAKGAGVAAALMDWTIAAALGEGADALYLGVWRFNHRAQRFYRRYGFEIVGEYEFVVGDTRDPEFVMRKPLA
ncbi:MAG: GNAT family N-acetyltransferase [Hydrogenophilaceae bacterium]|nr:GNAT family N-acetyltransferase [Hydrogenophilaceae bacterium]